MADILQKYDLRQFHKDLEELHIILSDSQIEQFLIYYEMLIEKNKVMNLTAITEFDEVMKKHFIDSLSLVKAYDSRDNLPISVIDIGTGGGFPGIPLKITFPHFKVTLMDSLNKRVDFLKEVIEELDLSDIDVIHGRAEDFAKPGQLREQYDLCVSRAVANLSDYQDLDRVSEWARPAMAWAVGQGIVSGVNNGGLLTLEPQRGATRAEMATMLQAFSEKIL